MAKAKDNTILISGHAKFPVASVARSQFDICTITIEAEIDTWKIVFVDCVLITDTAKNFISNIVSKQILDSAGLQAMAEEIEYRYHGYAKKTLLSALLDLEINLENTKKYIRDQNR